MAYKRLGLPIILLIGMLFSFRLSAAQVVTALMYGDGLIDSTPEVFGNVQPPDSTPEVFDDDDDDHDNDNHD